MADVAVDLRVAPAPQTRTKLLRMDRDTAVFTAVLLALGFVVLFPLLFLVFNSFQLARPGQPPVYGLANWLGALTEPGILTAIVNTITRSVVAMLIAFPFGMFIAWLLARTNLPGKNWLDLIFWLTFFLPPLPVTLGWMLLLDPQAGAINQVISMVFPGAPHLNIYSFWGIVWVHLVTKVTATKVILLVPIFRNMDASQEEAARTSGASALGTLWRIVVPVMSPAILTVFTLSTIYSLQSFEIEQVLGPPANFYVYSTKIYQLVHREPAQFGSATVLGVVILIGMLPLILAQQRRVARRSYTTVTGKFNARSMALGRWRWPTFGMIVGLGLLFTVLPIALLLAGSFMRLFGYFNLASPFTLGHWQEVLSDPAFPKALKNSVLLGGSTAVISVSLCSMMAYIAVKSRYAARGVIDFLSWLPVTIPGIIMSLGLLWVFLDMPFLRPLYGTMGILVWATALSSMALTVQLVKSHLLQIGSELEESARISGGSWLYTFRRVLVPLLMPTLVTVGLVSFISAVQNVAHVAILTTGENQPLAIFQLNYLSNGQYETAAVVGVIVVLMTTGVAIAGRVLGLRVGIQSDN
jgi:iron(III) transport system permease protein